MGGEVMRGRRLRQRRAHPVPTHSTHPAPTLNPFPHTCTARDATRLETDPTAHDRCAQEWARGLQQDRRPSLRQLGGIPFSPHPNPLPRPTPLLTPPLPKPISTTLPPGIECVGDVHYGRQYPTPRQSRTLLVERVGIRDDGFHVLMPSSFGVRIHERCGGEEREEGMDMACVIEPCGSGVAHGARRDIRPSPEVCVLSVIRGALIVVCDAGMCTGVGASAPQLHARCYSRGGLCRALLC